MTYGTINVDKVVNSDNVTSGGLYGFKNRIINGAMMIDQRNAGAAVTNVTGAYILDRWKGSGSTDGAVTIQQSTTAPAGFKNSLKLLVATADTSIAAGQYYQFVQPIEGYNVSDLGFGAVGAATVTVSFWVRSSKTGTYTATLFNGAGNRLCPLSFTINSADTWEQKVLTVAGDTTGTWATDNTTGLYLSINLAMGSNFNAGTSGTWGTSQFSVAGQVNWLDTVGATFYITGVQLEKGSTATSFDYRPYGTELALCQRYAYMMTSAGSAGNYLRFCYGETASTAQLQANVVFPVPMRSYPSLTVSATASNYAIYSKVTLYTLTSVPSVGDSISQNVASIVGNASGGGMTVGYCGALLANNNQAAYLLFTAEL